MKRDYITDYSQRDFVDLTINVMKPEIIPSEHKFFAGNEAFKVKVKGVDKDTIIKYIVLFYDPNSPLFERITDHIERKKAAALIAGWKVNDNKFPKEVDPILYCKSADTNLMILEYLRHLKTPDFAFIASANEAYYRILYEMMSDVTQIGGKETAKTSIAIASERAELSKKANLMAADLQERTLKFLAKDESPYLLSGLFDMVENENKLKALTPERQVFGVEI